MKIVTVLVLVLSFLASPVISQVSNDKLIIPGVRIGKSTLQMTLDDLLRANGDRNSPWKGASSLQVTVKVDYCLICGRKDAPPGLWMHFWHNVSLYAFTIGPDSQSVVGLLTFAEDYKTDKGLGLGSSKDAVQAAYGTPTAVTRGHGGLDPGWWSGIYDSHGIAFDVDSRNVTNFVIVFRPGSGRQLFVY